MHVSRILKSAAEIRVLDEAAGKHQAEALCVISLSTCVSVTEAVIPTWPLE